MPQVLDCIGEELAHSQLQGSFGVAQYGEHVSDVGEMIVQPVGVDDYIIQIYQTTPPLEVAQ